LPKAFFFVLVTLCAASSCRTTSSLPAESPAEAKTDGFIHGSLDDINQAIKENHKHGRALAFESEWLDLRTQVVEAEKYASECRASELTLAGQMAKFGSMDQRIPGEGFINAEQRVRWNAQLEIKKKARVTAEARANLLRRDLEDLRVEIEQAGFSVSQGPIVR
jgi:hypothetical protein